MGVNVDLKPAVNLLVLNLNSVDQSSGAIRASEVVEGDRPIIVFAVEGSFDLGNDSAGRDCGAGSSNGL